MTRLGQEARSIPKANWELFWLTLVAFSVAAKRWTDEDTQLHGAPAKRRIAEWVKEEQL